MRIAVYSLAVEAVSFLTRSGNGGYMSGNPHRFDRLELAGSLGDLGTLIPMAVALITLTGLSFTSVLAAVGFFYVLVGLYYRLPIPVQPLKVVSALAIAFPEQVTLPIMAATGLLFGAILVLLALTGLIEAIARLFTRPVVRGIQLGLGLILMQKGIAYLSGAKLLIQSSGPGPALAGLPLNLILGLAGAVAVLFLLNSRRYPAALVLVGAGILVGLAAGALKGVELELGPSQVSLFLPRAGDFAAAFALLVLPQIPLTIGNAVIGTKDAAKSLFGEGQVTARVTNRRLSLSMGLANLGLGWLAAMPLCHGAGGLAAHYRFGARTGGSNVMIGLIFLVIALVFGRIGLELLGSIPRAVLGVLLLFAGLELALLIRDVKERADLFVALLIAGVGLATTHMGLAFLAGMAAVGIIKLAKIEI